MRLWPLFRLRDHGSRFLISVCCIAAIMFLMIRLNTPITLFPDASGDDGLFIRLGQSLAAGNYLGPFFACTLCKGPGYSFFLAASHYTGMSVTLAQALFFILSIGIFSFMVSKCFGSAVVGAAVFSFTILHPTMLISRVLREAIYPSQVFLILAGLLATFVVCRRCSVVFGGATGLITSWFWITREEGAWIVPGIIFFIAIAFFLGGGRESLRQMIVGLLSFVFMLIAGGFAFYAMNWIFYGSFAGVDTKERNFTAAYAAVQSVQDGNKIPFVPVSASTRAKIYNVSPTFALLKKHLDPPNGRGPGAGCRSLPQTCGDIAAGHFIWEFRAAAAATGAYRTPADASTFFGKIASEVHAACNDGRLRCSEGLLPFLAPISTEQLTRIPARVWAAMRFTVEDMGRATLDTPSTGTREEIDAALRFLNFPDIKPARQARNEVEISGWLRWKGDTPLLISVLSKEYLPVPQLLEPLALVPAAYGRANEADGRRKFVLTAACDFSCTVSVVGGAGGAPVYNSVKSLLGAGRSLSSPDWDGFVKARTKAIPLQPGPATAAYLRRILTIVYGFVLPVMLPAGLLAVIGAAVLSWLRAGSMLLVGMASTLWILVLSRLGLIALAEVTSFGAISNHYLNVAMYLSTAAAVVSLSSLYWAWTYKESGSG